METNSVNRWVNYFETNLSKYSSRLEYAVAHWNFHLPVYYHIQHLIPAPAKLLEVGCGLGVSAIYLQACGYNVTAVDNHEEIVNQAQDFAQYFHSHTIIKWADAFDLAIYYGKFDLVYSIGVLEHFDREVTIQLLREQAQCGRYVLLGVPSRFTGPVITDERIYTLAQLRTLLREAGLPPLKSFGYGNPKKLLLLRYVLPYGLYRVLQNYFSLAQGLVVIGQAWH